MSAYSADNASVYFRKFNSVFQNVSDKLPKVIKDNYNHHVIHNAGRNGIKALSYDI